MGAGDSVQLLLDGEIREKNYFQRESRALRTQMCLFECCSLFPCLIFQFTPLRLLATKITWTNSFARVLLAIRVRKEIFLSYFFDK